MEPLDNPAWHALNGPQARFREGTALAARYDTEVSAFAALPDEPTAQAWDELRALVGPGGGAVLFRTDPVEIPDEWNVVVRFPTQQMVATGRVGDADATFTELGASDTADMLALVAKTRPGPFLARTHELGTYLGLRAGATGALIAMAGERMHFAGFTEISAVCTDPGQRKQGIGTRLVRAIAAGIEARGETPMLHVLVDNEPAIRVYEALGFRRRAAFDVTLVQAAP